MTCSGNWPPQAIRSALLLDRPAAREGFFSTPRRADEERPTTFKPETAAVADIRRLDLSPRTFRTPLAGPFLFAPLPHRMDIARVVKAVRRPGSKRIPAEQALRSLLALKLMGAERKSHVMDLVLDPAIALFAGLNVVLQRFYLVDYSSRVDHKASLCLREARLDQNEKVVCPMALSSTWTSIACPPVSNEEPGEELGFQP
jgi:hypothetical protein